MRREDRDDLIRSFLAINAMLREEAKALKRAVDARRDEAKHNPNWRQQPRAPKGTVEGGQWVGGGPKQAPQVRPETTTPEPPQDERFRIQNFARQTSANDNRRLVRIPLAATPLAALTLPLPLYGDTPRPKIEARQISEDLLLVTIEIGNRLVARFQRIVRPERQVPLRIFGIDTGLQTTEPAELEILDV